MKLPPYTPSEPLRTAGLDYWQANGLRWAEFVYVIRAEDDPPIKVGIARDVPRRLAGLQTGNPRQLELLFVFPGTVELERSLHKSLAPDRLTGEWFAGPTVDRWLEAAPFFIDWLVTTFEASRGAKLLPDFRQFPGWDWQWKTRKTSASPVAVRFVDPSTLAPIA